jgi:hypothetical protein
MTALTTLAANNFGDTMSGGLAGPMGLFIILLLALGTVLLIRNMNSRLRRLPERFPADPADGPASGEAPAAPARNATRSPDASGEKGVEL